MNRNFARFLMVGLPLVGVISCAHQQSELPGRAGALPVSGLEARPPSGHASLDELMSRFAEALANRDAQKLKELAITYEEFDRVVWPELDANRPETNLTSEFVWSQYDMRSQAHLERLLSRFGGRSYSVESVDFTGKPREYTGFVIHDDPVLTLIAEDGSREKKLFFGAVIEHQGHFRIYGYSTD